MFGEKAETMGSMVKFQVAAGRAVLRREINAWERQRNAAGARINWMFTTDKARAKMGRAYPVTSKES